jgi:hypothetical protein
MVFPEDGGGDEVIEGTGMDGKVVTGVTSAVTDGEVGMGIMDVATGDKAGEGVADVIGDGDVVVGAVAGNSVVPLEQEVKTATNIAAAARVSIFMPVKSFI